MGTWGRQTDLPCILVADLSLGFYVYQICPDSLIYCIQASLTFS